MIPVTNSGTTAQCDRAIDQAIALEGGDDSTEDRQRHDEHEGEGGELERVDERVADESRNGEAVGEGFAEITLEEARDPVPVLGPEGAVGAKLLVQVVDGRLVGERAEDAAGDVAGQHLRAEEDDDAEQPERDERETEPLEEEPRHRPEA
jgi:hypothetical protein